MLAAEFQFHKGTIRTRTAQQSDYRNKYFNSIKVRLEQAAEIQASINEKNFNSIKVRLEHADFASQVLAQLFQFHKGTIRTNQNTMIISLILYFNSIKVRLELGLPVMILVR